MIYLLGSSHIVAILDGVSNGGPESRLRRLDTGRAPQFMDWDTRPGVLPDRLQVASIYVRHTAPFWGPQLVEMLSPGVLGINPGFQRLLQSIDSADPANVLFVAVHGEEYFHLAGTAYPCPFDFYLPWRPDLPIEPGCQVLPLPVVQSQMTQRVSPAVRVLSAVRKFHPTMRIFNILCPPPAASEELARWLAANDREPHAAAEVRTALRLKYYLLYARALSEASRALGMGVLAPPEQALNADGTLNTDFVRDVVHGNQRYGELVLAQMAGVTRPALEGVH